MYGWHLSRQTVCCASTNLASLSSSFDCHPSSVTQTFGLIPRSGASSNYAKTLFRLLEIVPMYYDTSFKTSRVDWSALFSPRRWLSRNGKTFFFLPKGILKRREMDGRDETLKDTEDTTLVQMEEVERAIRALPFVTKLSPVGARNSHGHGYRVKSRAGTPHCTPVGRSC